MNDTWIPITLINQNKVENNCRFLSVTQEMIGKLKMIRPGVYLDDPRLQLLKDVPTTKPEPQAKDKISPERQAWIDGAYARYLAEQAAKATPAAIQTQPMLFEEKLQYDWKHSPAIRSEFISFASYAAYCRAVRDGRTKVYGKA